MALVYVCSFSTQVSLDSITFLTSLNPLHVTPGDTVQNVKMKIKDQVEIPPDHQQLFFEDMELKNDRTLSDYKKASDFTISMRLAKLVAAPSAF